MNNKTLIYKPTLEYHHANRKSKNKNETISLKDWIKEILTNCFLFLLGICIFVLTIGIAYNTYLLIKIKVEKISLIKENQALKKEYQFLTSREVILKKAKTLGLYPPKKKDFLRLE